MEGDVPHHSEVSSKLQNINAKEKIAFLNGRILDHYHMGHYSQWMTVVRNSVHTVCTYSM